LRSVCKSCVNQVSIKETGVFSSVD
jgi:hypothetical protein